MGDRGRPPWAQWSGLDQWLYCITLVLWMQIESHWYKMSWHLRSSWACGRLKPAGAWFNVWYDKTDLFGNAIKCHACCKSNTVHRQKKTIHSQCEKDLWKHLTGCTNTCCRFLTHTLVGFNLIALLNYVCIFILHQDTFIVHLIGILS